MLEDSKPDDDAKTTSILKSDDKKEIEEEEKKRMIGGEEISRSEVEKKKKVLEQAVEGAARRRAPTGGIRVPGFLRVSRSRDKNKEGEGDGEEGTDLLESPNTETKTPDDQQPPPSQSQGSNKPLLSKLNLKAVPFMKKKRSPEDQDDEKQHPQVEELPEDGPRRPKLINAIKLPLASFIPNKLRTKENEENGPQAGLASMETLDDSNGSKAEDKMETVKLENDIDPEKAALEDAAKNRGWNSNSWKQYKDFLKEYKMAVGGIFVFIVLLLVLLIYVAFSPKAPIHAPIKDGKFVKAVTSCGHVEGILENGIFVFRGIPYANPPIGQLRFTAPTPLRLSDCWNSTFKAHGHENRTTFSCWQMFPNGSIDGTEDCLTIDVYTPHVRYDSPLPVVVAVGVADIGVSPNIVRSKDMVVVVPRVRQGPLGFTASHYLTQATYPKSSGNYGLADLVAALKWVKLNIENFGGNKKEITVLGWRQGATLATALTVIQKPQKLFNRLWLSSGSAIFPNTTLSESEKESSAYIDQLHCRGPISAECLKNLDVEELLDALPNSWRPAPRGNLPGVNGMKHQWLVQDGLHIRESPYTVWEQMENNEVDVVIGTTVHSEIDEAWVKQRKDYTESDIRKEIEESAIGKMNLTDKALELYNATLLGLAEMISDIATVCPLYSLSKKIPGAKFYLMGQYDNSSFVFGGKDIEAIFGWIDNARPQTRRSGGSVLHLFHKYAALDELPDYQSTLITQDTHSLRDGLPRCVFWETAGFSEYAWVD